MVHSASGSVQDGASDPSRAYAMILNTLNYKPLPCTTISAEHSQTNNLERSRTHNPSPSPPNPESTAKQNHLDRSRAHNLSPNLLRPNNTQPKKTQPSPVQALTKNDPGDTSTHFAHSPRRFGIPRSCHNNYVLSCKDNSLATTSATGAPKLPK